MNYIPLEAAHSTASTVFLILGIGLLVLSAVVLVFSIILAKRRGGESGLVPLFAVLLILGVFGIIGSGIAGRQGPEASTEQQKALATQIEDRYGIELSDSQLKELRYPTGKPTADENFGSVIVEVEEKGTPLTLSWKKDHFELQESASGDELSKVESASKD